jgi:hypothetical protein
MNNARDRIAKGRLFIKKAVEIGFTDRDSFRHYIEAAIEAARSVTWLLQKQYNVIAGFGEWYTIVQEKLNADPLSRFLLKQRNFVVKEGIAEIRKVINLEVHSTIHLTESVTVKITRGTWQSRLRHLPDDTIYSLKEKWAEFEKNFRHRQPLPSKDSSKISEQYYFMDEVWASTPVIELLLRQFENLEKIVEEASQRFGEPPSDAL